MPYRTPSSSSPRATAAAAAVSSARVMRVWGGLRTSSPWTWRSPAARRPRRRCCGAFSPRSPRPLPRLNHGSTRPPQPTPTTRPLEIAGGSAIFRASAASECRPIDIHRRAEMTGLLGYESPLDRALGAFFAPVNGTARVAGGSIDLDVVETPEAYVVKAE